MRIKFENSQKLLEYLEALPLQRSVSLRRKTDGWVVGQNRKPDVWLQTLQNIRGRCNAKNPETKKFKYYAAKGIKCLITANELKALYIRDKASEMKKPSIDRINPKDHYTFENCRYIENRANVSRSGNRR